MAKESSRQSPAVPGRIGSIRHYSADSKTSLLRFHYLWAVEGLAAVEVAAGMTAVALAAVALDCLRRWRLRLSVAVTYRLRLPWNLRPKCQN
jgi:hypothetical protein